MNCNPTIYTRMNTVKSSVVCVATKNCRSRPTVADAHVSGFAQSESDVYVLYYIYVLY